MMGGGSGVCRGEDYRQGQIGEKWEMVTSAQKAGKGNRMMVIGDAEGRKRSATVLQTSQESLRV